MLQYELNLIEFPELKTEQINGDRHYVTPNGRYPSITTILSKQPNKVLSLAKWKERIGNVEAARQTAVAAKRGTIVHKLFEDYITDGRLPNNTMPTTLQMFNQMRKVIDEHLETVMAREAPLYSDELKVAGRCDLIGAWKGNTSVIDFKTSRTEKKKEWILDYFIQCTAYAIMFEERTKKPCNNIVIVLGCDDTPVATVYEEKRSKYEVLARNIISAYHEKILDNKSVIL